MLVLGTKVDLAESRKVDSGQAQVIEFLLTLYTETIDDFPGMGAE